MPYAFWVHLRPFCQTCDTELCNPNENKEDNTFQMYRFQGIYLVLQKANLFKIYQIGTCVWNRFFLYVTVVLPIDNPPTNVHHLTLSNLVATTHVFLFPHIYVGSWIVGYDNIRRRAPTFKQTV